MFVAWSCLFFFDQGRRSCPGASCIYIYINYIKQLRLKDTLHWTPLFLKENFNTHEYDILLDRVGHSQEPHVLNFLICAFVVEL